MPSVSEQIGLKTPPGYRQNAAGLLVREELSRTRLVWTKKQFKAIDTAIQFLLEKDVALFMKCKREGCPAPRLTLVQTAGGSQLQCGCAIRVFQKAF